MYQSKDLVWFYKGEFSNFHKCSFICGDMILYNCTEQYFMAKKAETFGDMDIYTKIMNSNSPYKQKQLGRQVKNFDEIKWNKIRENIMIDANCLKFVFNKELKDLLLSTGDKELAEASPRDRIWGIGLGANNPNITDKSKWRGQNLLGKCLMIVRDMIKSGEN